MSKRTKIVVLLIVLAVLVALGAAWKWQRWEKQGGAATWSVVYLSSGEIYVGQLSWARKARLDGAYLVTRVQNEKDPKSNDIRLQPLNETVWAPTTLYLNRDHILFYGPLDENSTAASRLRERGVMK